MSIKQAKRRKKYKIVSKVRFTISMTVLICTFVFCTIHVFGLSKAMSESKEQLLEVIVDFDDTLWEIAQEHNYNDEDVRKVIYEIKEINDLDSSEIYAGQILYIPLK